MLTFSPPADFCCFNICFLSVNIKKGKVQIRMLKEKGPEESEEKLIRNT
jgi:hypothetical protein